MVHFDCLFFQVAAGREWYIHTIYTVRSKENANRGIGKRSLEYHSLVSPGNRVELNGLRSRRSASNKLPEVAQDIGEDNNRGTNIMHIALDHTKRRGGASELFSNGPEPSELNSEEEEEGLVTVVGALVGLLLTVLIVFTIILVLKSKKKDGKEGWREGVQEVVKGSVSTEPMLVVRMQGCHNSSEVWGQDALVERWREGEDVGSFLKFRFFFFFTFIKPKNPLKRNVSLFGGSMTVTQSTLASQQHVLFLLFLC